MNLRQRAELLIRYYGVGALNTAFGFGLYSLLVAIGLNLFIAQVVAHVCGTAFNYVTYSRHVFRNSERRPVAFGFTYVFNYLTGLGLLAAAHRFVASPYLAGFLALLVGTSVNFLALRAFAFRDRPGVSGRCCKG